MTTRTRQRNSSKQQYEVPPAQRTRETPQSLEAEQSTLGAMMMERDAIKRAIDLLQAEDFYRESHRVIFAVIIDLYGKDEPVDFITVSEELRRRGHYDEVGGMAYLVALTEACPSSSNVESYARVVIERSVARAMLREVEILQSCLTLPGNGDTDYLAPLARLELRLREVQERKSTLKGGHDEYSDDTALDALFDNISWLWPGWVPRGHVTLLVGRPGAGKSTVAMDMCKRIIQNMAWPDGQELEVEDPFEDDKPVKLLWIDTESGLGIFRQRLEEWEFPRGHFVFPKNRETAALRVDDDADWAWICRAVADLKPPLVVVDSLAASHSGEENSNDIMKLVMLRLADLARENNCGVLCIHHLNKLPAGVSDWPLGLEMVRGASAIGQYARSVIGVGTPDKSEPLAHGFMSIKLNVGCANDPIGYQTTDFGPAWGKVEEAIPRIKPVERAKNWLRDQLRDGRKLSSDLFDMAKEEKICSARTLQTASREMDVRATKEPGPGGRWFWELRG